MHSSTLPTFQYPTYNPIEYSYSQYDLLNTQKHLHNHLIGDYLILLLPAYIYMYTYDDFEEPICYAVVEDIVRVVSCVYFHMPLRYQYLIDISAVDYYANKLRFQLNYNLVSMLINSRLQIKTFIGESGKIASIASLFDGADWYEREIWDLFGIIFSGHNDLRRLLTDYAFEGFPLKKDFPLSGFMEVRFSEIIKRLAYNSIKSIQEFRIFELQSPWEYLIKTNFPDLFDIYKEKKNTPIHLEYLYIK